MLVERRFGPLFITQVCGAFNDYLLKSVLFIVLTDRTVVWNTQAAALPTGIEQGLTTVIAPGLPAAITLITFIVPFLLFSGIAAQVSQRFDKALISRSVKALEIVIMWVAGWGLLGHRAVLLLVALFMMGANTTFFAPAKYGSLPEVLDAEELVGGNALLEAGTFFALPLAVLTAGVLAAGALTAVVPGVPAAGVPVAGGALAIALVVAVVGFAASLFIPRSVAAVPGRRVDLYPWSSMLGNLRAARRSRAVLLSMLGVSWFWFFGALIMMQLPLYGHALLHGDETLVALTLTMWAAGLVIGALLCERLSGRHVEIGLVPFGSIGLTLCALDWVIATPHVQGHLPVTARSLVAMHGGLRTLFDLAAIGMFGGFFIVPLNALVQQRSPSDALPRVIGASVLSNAVFMAAGAAIGAVCLASGLRVKQLILMAAAMNAAVAAYIYTLVPEFLLRFVCWLLMHSLYRLMRGGHRFPESGAALIVCNHVSFIDALVISAACRRPIHFIMDNAFFHMPVIRTLSRGMKAIPISSARDDPALLERAFAAAAAALRDGELVCIFPEGRLTVDGSMAPFKTGLSRILRETPVPVIPIAIVGLWGSMFSRYGRRLWQRLPRKLWHRVVVNVGAAVPPERAEPAELRKAVAALYEKALSGRRAVPPALLS